jgi:CRISPR-associated endonuclease/helicase Cas3
MLHGLPEISDMSRPFETFEQALSAAGFEERGKQRNVFDAFRAGKHVILHAPTGWGKTFAVLAALVGGGHSIYSLPMRSLVDSVAEEANKLDLVECAAQHGARREHELLDRGDDPSDPTECVFTTLDQTLSAFLGIPVGVSMRQGNVMPAVVDASHLVFDEFHLFEPEKSWTTALFALQRSQQNGIILTATLSDAMVGFLEEHLANSKVGAVEVVRGERPFVNTKTARRGAGLDQVEKLEIGQRTIIIRNQVEWAQQTAEALRKRNDIEGKVHLLHSELLPEDRETIEEEVRRVFGEDSDAPGVLVATQVVEAGIDVTCDVMHTDLCPPPAFIQRIGRCARYKDETGRIFLHSVKSAAPYTGQAEEMDTLRDYIGTERVIDPEAEHEIVNLAEERDRKTIRDFKKRNDRKVSQLRVDPDYSEYRQHIRDINSLDVAIGWKLDAPYEFIGVSQSKFYAEDSKYNREGLPITFVGYDADRKVYDAVEQPHEADFALLSPEHARYDPGYGIRIGATGGEEHFIGEKASWTRPDYDAEEAEPYWLHIQRLKDKQPVTEWIIERLAKDPHVGNPEAAAFLADFVTWAHDLGKLNYPWQGSFGVARDGEPIAHSGGDFTAQEGVRRPPHGWMSAWAVRDYVWEVFSQNEKAKKLRRAVFWAIADHHGYSHKMKRTSLTNFELGYPEHLDQMPEHMAWVRSEWKSSILTTSVKSRSELERIYRFMRQNRREPSDANGVYFALSYILRRTDWLATSLHFTEEEEVEQEDKSNNRIIA